MNNFSTKLISSICTFWLITNTALALEVGDQAPDFLLQATDGKTYSLSEFKGEKSVVLAWFPQAFTSGCTIECKSLAENGHLIQEYNAQYFMISVDDIEVNTAFAIEHDADFPLLSDPSKQTAMDYENTSFDTMLCNICLDSIINNVVVSSHIKQENSITIDQSAAPVQKAIL